MQNGLVRDGLADSLAKKILRTLLEVSECDLLTCHFFNPHSGAYWLYHKDFAAREVNGTKGFYYPWQMDGPLTHPDQRSRFGDLPGGHIALRQDNMTVELFESLPAELTNRVLAGESFPKREQISKVIRISLEAEEATPYGAKGKVVIFLNYRHLPGEGLPQLEEHCRCLYGLLLTSLVPLAAEPRLSASQAWLLRSANVKFRELLTELLVPEGAQLQEGHAQAIYDFITKYSFSIISPVHGGKNLLASLLLLGPDNAVHAKSAHPKKPSDHPSFGVVRYVSITGQMFHIQDVREYRQRWVAGDSSRPEFIECDLPEERTQSELACPLVLQGRVVGVLNIEADVKEAYDDSHVLILHQICAMAALAVRQISLWNELGVAIEHQHELLQLNEESQIIDRTLLHLKQAGFGHAGVWMHGKGWSPRRDRRDIRPEGYTKWIISNGRAVALADFRVEGGQQYFEERVGRIDEKSKCFQGWSDDEPKPGINNVSEDLIDFFREEYTSQGAAAKSIDWDGVRITDLGFPVFVGQTVDGVLWVKCNRLFRSITADEGWFLSMICRNLGETLLNARRRYKEFERKDITVLEAHFGPKKSEEILGLMKQNPQVLLSREIKNVIVMHLDIRGSTQLSDALAIPELLTGSRFVDFIGGYHKLAFEEIFKARGVVDKTVGDGVIAMFNLFASDGELDWEGTRRGADDKERAKKEAVDTVLAIFEKFREYKASFYDQMPPGHRAIIDEDVRLGGALSIGTSHVGCFNPNGIEYTAYGDVANDAGKLVDRARGDKLREVLRNAARIELVEEDGISRPLKPEERSAFFDIGLSPQNSVLLTHQTFVSPPSDSRYRAYIVLLSRSNKSPIHYSLFARCQ